MDTIQNKCCSLCNSIVDSHSPSTLCTDCSRKPLQERKISTVSSNVDSLEGSYLDAARESKKPVQKSKVHCYLCNSKIGFMGFTCKCSLIFCGTHRLAEDHDCSFDYKSMKQTEVDLPDKKFNLGF